MATRRVLVGLALGVGCLMGCAGPRSGEPTAQESASRRGVADVLGADVERVDLTYPLSPEGLYWPTGTPFEHRRLDWGQAAGGYWYASAAFSSPEHLGTHIDAPLHFAEHGWTVAEIPVDRLMAPGALIDITDRVGADRDATLATADIDAWEAANGTIPSGTIVLVRTGWSSRWPDWNGYYGSETPKDVTTLHFPGVSPGAATRLVERGVYGVGIDTASIDPGVSQTFETHQVLGAANIFNLENLTALDRLPSRGFVVMAMPMKITDGTGSPTRVVALLDR